ncbi:MAG: amidohydrolase family protein [Spirochaetia bacterium]|jgi:cytosine/adenosine deaminase-related metal-dependent hydrolase|nr:amidohydrolase family protein [Spirochaetia bacterium]
MNWTIDGVTIPTYEDNLKNIAIEIENDSIASVSKKSISAVKLSIDNGVAVPGLINGHDHLIGNYYPKIGNGPYPNWLPWDNDLKSSPVYRERQLIENRDLYLSAAYRHLISGVTTVSDHIPPFVAEPFYDLLPMKAIRRYALSHSLSSFALNWGDPTSEYKRAAENDIPFVTHLSEGFDNESRAELDLLDRKGALGPNSVLVHGIAFSENDMDRIKAADASVVWCGDSNMFMYNRTMNVGMLLDKEINACIGTDSPASGGLNLLYEMKFDRTLYRKLTGKILEDHKIVEMVTANPAKAFKLHKNGSIKVGNLADITIFRYNGNNPWQSVVDAEFEDVLLVIIDGLPAYGKAEYSPIFDELGVDYQRVIIKGEERVVIGDLIGLMKRISRAVGFKKDLPYLPVEFDF